MDVPESLQGKSSAELEEWFLAALEQDERPTDTMLAVLRKLRADSQHEKAALCAELLQEALIADEDKDGLLDLMGMRCGWEREGAALREACQAAARAGFKDRLGAAFVKNAGFDDKLPVEECVRRLRLLNRLGQGVLCNDKTWGFGVVRRLDDFYEKVTIDFRERPRHQMSFRYAAETLELIDESHLQARRYRDPQALAEMAASDPGGLVRIALRSYGPLNAVELQELLVDDFVAEGDWKGFWDRARKDLKADPKVEFPSRRTAAIELLDRAKEYDAAWFAELAEERDMKRILALVGEYREEADTSALDDAGRAVLADRLGFVAHGASGNQPAIMARAVLAADAFDLVGSDQRLAAAIERLFEPADFEGAVNSMPSRQVGPLLALLWLRRADGARSTFLSGLDKVKFSVVSALLDFLASREQAGEAAAVIGRSLRSRTPGLSLVLWACRHPERLLRDTDVSGFELMTAAVTGLEAECAGEELRSQNQLRKLFEDVEWLQGMLNDWEPSQRMALMNRVINSRGWDASGRRSMMARLIKLYPELHEAVAGDDDEAAQTGESGAQYTSWRSYRQRQAQLRRLIEEEIPANSREIAVARSYGDLRENFEYQAAKDQQRILMQRQREWERDLQEVRGTDFRGFPVDKAGPGTRVVLAGPEGKERIFCILGEWDRDEELGIIASGSRLAMELAGKRPGEDVMLSIDGTGAPWQVREVGEVPEDVRRWIAADASAAAGTTA